MEGEFNNLKILIVEDTESTILVFKSALKRTGAELLFAFDGIQAINLVNANPDIDIILMDINLPELDGIEATKQIKKLYPEIPIIVQTGYVYDFTERDCYLAGGDYFIEKPIRFSLLKKAITELVNKRGNHENIEKVS